MIMNHNLIFSTFYFKPTKLQTVVQKLEEKYQHEDSLSEKLIRRKLPDLLAQIKALSNNEAEIILFSKGLKIIDINILSSAYPYETEDVDTVNKIIIIISNRYSSLIGRRFWNHFQHRIHDENINKVLYRAFQKEDEGFLGLFQRIRANYQEVFTNTQPPSVLNTLARYIGGESKQIDEVFKIYKIEEDSKLANELWLQILGIYIKVPGFVEMHGVDSIEKTLDNLYLKRYKSIITVYLKAFDYSNYHATILRQVIDRLKDPRENKEHWNDVSPDIIDKVKMYLNEQDLHHFFDTENDHERFNYWKKYVKYIQNIKLISDPPIAALYYDDFVVIEFANKGNAAYFYETSGFDRTLASKMRPYIREEILKDTDAEFFITKLNHAGYWPSRYDKYMANYLNGNFYYSHNH